MQITLEQLTLINFKGIRQLEIPFTHSTNIYGQNGTGKTTVMDAFLWLLFGKDSSDRKTFEIKTLDKNNAVIPRIEHTVIGKLLVDGVPNELKKTLREKWTKKRGALVEEFTGNEVVYWWNDVPMLAGDFEAKIKSFVPEDVFKLITNPLYFNGLEWSRRRNALMQIAGELTDMEVAGANPDFIALLKMLTAGKTMEQYKKEVREKINKLKTEKEHLPARIDEVFRGRPEVRDWPLIQASLDVKKGEIERLENALNDHSAAEKQKQDAVIAKQREQFTIDGQKREIEFAIKSRLQREYQERNQEPVRLRSLISTTTDTINGLHRSLSAAREKLATKTLRKEALVSKWYAIDGEQLTFDDGLFSCPACKRPLEETDIASQKQALTENFNTEKARRLAEANADGTELKSEILELEKVIETLDKNLTEAMATKSTAEQTLLAEESKLQVIATQEEAFKTEIAANEEYQQLAKVTGEITAQIAAITAPTEADSRETTRLKKQNLQREIDDLRTQLATKETIAACDQRKAQLEQDQSSLVQQIADLERTEFTIFQFEKVRIETLEGRINHRFKYVSFKMFETQINGQEVPCCHTLIKGVPFPDANNAAKVNAGVDIINVLCDHYRVWAPIFIDNRESVTDIIDSKSQQVNLIVTAEDKVLKIA
jgi:DNA repair protein SbcC/Rad50